MCVSVCVFVPFLPGLGGLALEGACLSLLEFGRPFLGRGGPGGVGGRGQSTSCGSSSVHVCVSLKHSKQEQRLRSERITGI